MWSLKAWSPHSSDLFLLQTLINNLLHGDGNGRNPAESAENPREWVQLLREYYEDGSKTCGNTTGMEFTAAGNLRGVFVKRATIQF